MLKAKRFSSVELTEAHLARIEALDRELNAFITVDADRAMADARAADAAIAKGAGGPLTGIPIAHKDILVTAGMRTTCGSRMLANYTSPFDAPGTVERLARAGTVLLGKTNMDEFAMGSSSETSHFGPVRNPWHFYYVPGGSSAAPRRHDVFPYIRVFPSVEGWGLPPPGQRAARSPIARPREMAALMPAAAQRRTSSSGDPIRLPVEQLDAVLRGENAHGLGGAGAAWPAPSPTTVP